MTKKSLGRLVFAFFIVAALAGADAALAAGTVRMKIVIVNPSTTKTQTQLIKTYLPKEVKQNDIKDTSGLEMDYDDAQEMFYVTKEVSLNPGETKIFEITMDDIWLIAQEKLDLARKRTENVMSHLKETPYFTQAEAVAKTIYGRLDGIVATQNDTNVTKQQHIAYYRDNLKIMDSVAKDIEHLEKIVVAVGGTPNLELLEQSKVDLNAPTSKTTWVIIFGILVFIAVLAAAFYFTWQSQVHVTENIFTREKDQSFPEFKRSSNSADEPEEKTT